MIVFQTTGKSDPADSSTVSNPQYHDLHFWPETLLTIRMRQFRSLQLSLALRLILWLQNSSFLVGGKSATAKEGWQQKSQLARIVWQENWLPLEIEGVMGSEVSEEISGIVLRLSCPMIWKPLLSSIECLTRLNIKSDMRAKTRICVHDQVRKLLRSIGGLCSEALQYEGERL